MTSKRDEWVRAAADWALTVGAVLAVLIVSGLAVLGVEALTR